MKDVIAKNRKIATKYHKSYAFKYNVEEEQKKREEGAMPVENLSSLLFARQLSCYIKPSDSTIPRVTEFPRTV